MGKHDKTNRRAQKKADRKRKSRDAKRKELANRSVAPKPSVDPGPRPAIEVSPAYGMTADEFVETLVAKRSPVLANLRQIRRQKVQGERPRPSQRLVGDAQQPSDGLRAAIVDKVAELVDENLFGRSEMCRQFAALVERALRHLGIGASARMGKARYLKPDGSWFEWDHAWVEYDGHVVDGNVDTMKENPRVDEGVDPHPFWGRTEEIPNDRVFDFTTATSCPGDEDCDAWWPRLRASIDAEVGNGGGPSVDRVG